MDDDLGVAPDLDPGQEAERARFVAAQRLSRPYRQEGIAPAVEPTDQPSDVLPSDRVETDAGEVGLAERARLNFTNQYYRGTLSGAANLAAMAHVVTHPDEENLHP